MIDPFDLVEKYGLDPVRYFLLREVPFGNDGDYSNQAMINRLNSDLANDLGNLCQRVLSMVGKNCDASVPVPGDISEADTALLDAASALLDKSRAAFDRQQFHTALISICEVIGDANRYVDAQEPWKLRKEDPARMATVLYVLADTIRQLGILVQPFMPESGAKILDQLAVPDDARDFDALGTRLTGGAALPKPQPVFPRYVDPDAEEKG